ncbi:MAG: T9SS type A sorting domain-containing protein [Bacteroidales bacterium]|nr:T9SS type A sorting domain-containing protein [Bacteroidales bacterium]
MKKALLSLVFISATIFMMAQTTPREMVVVEVGTGTWCTYCPGAAMGVDDLLANGKKVAVVENHNGDTYANAYSNARNSLYNITGYPTATFDGNQAVVGGSYTVSMYPNYLPKYNSAIAVASPVEMDMTETHTGLDYTITFTITKLGTVTATNVRLNFAVTQSHIMQNWQGQTHLEHVNRLMVPDQNGTLIDFTSGPVQTVVLNFSMLPAWPLEDCEFVAWLQNLDAGQGNITGGTVKKWTTFQGLKRGVIDLVPEFSASATSINAGELVTFTNETTGGYIGVPETYQWTFPGGAPATSTQKNPVVTYDICGTYDVMLIVDRGSQIDTITKTAYIQVAPVINVVANPDTMVCWYQTITLDATTPGAVSYLWTPGGATTPTIDVTYAQYGIGAHNFNVLVDMGACQDSKTISTYLDACTRIGEKSKDVSISVFPNPSHGEFTLEMNASQSVVADLSITNNLGISVYTETDVPINGKTLKNLNLSGLGSGLYLLNIQNGEMKISQKILIK